ncbi:MAG: hypothetical protein FJW20_26140 [Acidimicrobiia bacterium]|nr:hypothetical protein [Acidimicrobiia bacterium]
MPVLARALLRRMRGGAQAHLLEADDGHCYVVKFKNNPQHRRILINEWLGSEFLRYLQITAPEPALVEITNSFASANPDLHIQTGTRRTPPDPGRHFGSRYPGDPARVAIFDFLPDALLAKVANLNDFLGVYVLDRFAGNADARQCIFYRAQVAHPHSAGPAFIASMVDHGFLFDGPNWRFPDAPLHGLYHRPSVYRSVAALDDFQPWIERVRHMPDYVLDSAMKQIPLEWLDGDHQELERLLERLAARRHRIHHLVEDACAAGKAFPNWPGSPR